MNLNIGCIETICQSDTLLRLNLMNLNIGCIETAPSVGNSNGYVQDEP